MADAYKPRLRKLYDETIAKAMIEKFGYKNALEIPRIEKIVLNMGVGEATQDKKRVEQAASEMELIAGQKPVITRAKKSIAQFKLREGMPIGVKVTLRRERMYEFLDRFITIALPRVRDFRGLNPKSFDGRGNFRYRDAEAFAPGQSVRRLRHVVFGAQDIACGEDRSLRQSAGLRVGLLRLQQHEIIGGHQLGA